MSQSEQFEEKKHRQSRQESEKRELTWQQREQKESIRRKTLLEQVLLLGKRKNEVQCL